MAFGHERSSAVPVQRVRTVKGRCKNRLMGVGPGSPTRHPALEMTLDIAMLKWFFAVMTKPGIGRW
jgi:hypothetical protein